jgi:hypothetical protein
LFHQIFVKENKKKKEYITLFCLIDLLKINNIDKDKSIKKQLELYIDNTTQDKIKKINILLRTKKQLNLNNLNVRKNLPSHKCIEPINKVNICIFFLIKTSVFLFREKNEIYEKEFQKYLTDAFVKILHNNIFNFKTKWKKYYNEELHQNFQLYKFVKEFYDGVLVKVDDLKSLITFLKDELPITAKSLYDINLCNSSCFIWKGNESDYTAKNKINNRIDESEINENNKNVINENNEKEGVNDAMRQSISSKLDDNNIK